MGEVSNILARIERGETDAQLLEAVAVALGWSQRKVTGLGLNGRTPGRWRWCDPEPPWTVRAKLPALLGPRSRSETIRKLQALKDAPK